MRFRLHVAGAIALVLLTIGCASGGQPPIDLSKIPIVIAVPADRPKPEVAPAPNPRATIAFQVLEEGTDKPIGVALVSFEDGTTKPVNDEGYVAFEREAGTAEIPKIYTVKFEADDYEPVTRKFALLDANRQFPPVHLKSTKPAPPIVPAPAPVVVAPAPPAQPPAAAAPAPTPPPAPVVPTLCATRATDPLACVRAVAAAYSQLLVINTFDACVEFTQRVLEVLGEPWGHVAKTAGEGQGVPRGFSPVMIGPYRITGVSYDAIKNRLSGQVIDLLGNATANEPCNPSTLPPGDKCWEPGPANVHWDEVPAQYWRANNPFLAAIPVR